MAGIRQFQRHAIESLSEHLSPLFFAFSGQKFYLDRKEIFLLGFSECVGSCGEMKGIMFAVFGSEPNNFVIDQQVGFVGCVFLRDATEAEMRRTGNKCMKIVEALWPRAHWPEPNIVFFSRVKGIQAEYISTIC